MARGKSIASLLIDLNLNSVGVSAGVKETEGGLRGFVRRVDDMGRRFGLPFNVSTAAMGLAVKRFVTDSVQQWQTEQEEIAKTEAILRSTGGAAHVTAADVDELTSSLQDQVLVEDDLIRQGANLLLTFKNVRNEGAGLEAIFDRATVSALDLSATGFGSIESASKMLGKALNDPLAGLTALSRAGVTFTQQQKDQIRTLVESNQILEAQKLILAEVESQVGGTAKAAADVNRPVKEMAIAWGELHEMVGGAVVPILGVLADVLQLTAPLLELVAGRAGQLLIAFLAYKALQFLPTLLRKIALEAVAMKLGGVANAANSGANALKGLGAAAGPAFAILSAGTLIFDAVKASAAESEAAVMAAIETLKTATEGSQAYADALAAIEEHGGVLADEIKSDIVPNIERMKREAEVAGDRGIGQLRHSLREISRNELPQTAEALDDVNDRSLRLARVGLADLVAMVGTTEQELRQGLRAAAEEGGNAIGLFVRDTLGGIHEWREGMAESLNFVDDAFDEIASKDHFSADQLLGGMQKALDAQKDFSKNLRTIRSVGGEAAEGLVLKLASMGEEGARAAQKIADSGKDGVREFVGAWNTGAGRAAADAKRMSDQIVGTLGDIRDVLVEIARAWGIDINLDTGDFYDAAAGIKSALDDLTQPRMINIGLGGAGAGQQLAAASGFHGWVHEPTTILAGEGGESERVDITPASKVASDMVSGRSGGRTADASAAPVVIHAEGATFVGYQGIEELADMIADAQRHRDLVRGRRGS